MGNYVKEFRITILRSLRLFLFVLLMLGLSLKDCKIDVRYVIWESKIPEQPVDWLSFLGVVYHFLH
jgi:hypothetical protein